MADKITSKKNREQFGNPEGRFPIRDHHSAESALKLRGHGDTPKEQTENRVSRFANKTGDNKLKEDVKKARKRDKGK